MTKTNVFDAQCLMKRMCSSAASVRNSLRLSPSLSTTNKAIAFRTNNVPIYNSCLATIIFNCLVTVLHYNYTATRQIFICQITVQHFSCLVTALDYSCQVTPRLSNACRPMETQVSQPHRCSIPQLNQHNTYRYKYFFTLLLFVFHIIIMTDVSDK